MQPLAEPTRLLRPDQPLDGNTARSATAAAPVALGLPSADGDYYVRLQPLPDLDRLEVRWREMERQADVSYFVSWHWIGAWLALICPPRLARLASVYQNGRRVAMGVFTVRRRWFGLGPMHLRLHEVGDKALDNLTIEYNGLLCERGHEREALAAVIRYLTRANSRWLTFYLPGVDTDSVPFDRIRSDTVDTRIMKRSTHYVDLAALRDSGGDYLSTALSSGARAAVRRTARKLESQFGELSVIVADTQEQKLAFFHAMVQLHQAHWSGEQDEHGAFGDPRILHFHESLITDATTDEGEGAQLVRLDAGGHVVGYVYNLVWRGVVYFYQAGIDYPRFGDFGSPGLLLLSRTIERTLEDGHARFELMAGDSEYKRTLGVAEGKMIWLSLDRIGWTSRLRRAWWSLTRRDG
ncbi:GNAT family N-acetyltransferase [Pseudoxanthomonas sp. UTMC 1351]|uniref:GNAT family N-acetyltransferase n=1 Tax=Pseudoxanthomonas sp. UTMC 1351 TaxID=2695853 RepID=UPI0034D00F85